MLEISNGDDFLGGKIYLSIIVLSSLSWFCQKSHSRHSSWWLSQNWKGTTKASVLLHLLVMIDSPLFYAILFTTYFLSFVVDIVQLFCFLMHVLLVNVVVKKGYKYGRIAEASITRLTWWSWHSCNRLEGMNRDLNYDLVLVHMFHFIYMVFIFLHVCNSYLIFSFPITNSGEGSE